MPQYALTLTTYDANQTTEFAHNMVRAYLLFTLYISDCACPDSMYSCPFDFLQVFGPLLWHTSIHMNLIGLLFELTLFITAYIQSYICVFGQSFVSRSRALASSASISELSWRNAALASSMDFISKLGSDDLASCSPFIADDVLFMSPHTTVPSRGSRQFVRDIEELSRLDDLRIVPSRITLDVIDLSSKSWLVAARYSINRADQTGKTDSTSVQQSMVWAADDSDPGLHLKLVACHISLLGDQPNDNSVTAESVRSFASEFLRSSESHAGGTTKNPVREAKVALQARDSKGLTHWVQPSSVVYVEAAHQYTNVYCRDRSIRLRTPFSTVVDQLGDVVIKVHRSYAVNPAYVSTLENEMLYLVTGDKVPVPAKRVKAVRATLADCFAQLGMRE